METLDFVTVECLEPGDFFEFVNTVYKLIAKEDEGDIIHLEVLDEYEDTDDLEIAAGTIVPIKGYFYDVED